MKLKMVTIKFMLFLGWAILQAKTADPNQRLPFFDVEWVEMFKNSKSKCVEPYVKLIEEISKDVDTFVNACDYDIEGSVIGYNALLYGAKTDISKSFRMKFFFPYKGRDCFRIRKSKSP